MRSATAASRLLSPEHRVIVISMSPEVEVWYEGVMGREAG
jgi:hypothetical protein